MTVEPGKGRHVSMEELSLVLWRERELLNVLLFKLEEEQLLLANGRTRWLAYAAREVETVLEAMRQTEVLRATVADVVAASMGLESNPSLWALVVASVEPWRTILLDHQQAFVAVTAQISESAVTNLELLGTGYQAARDTMAVTVGQQLQEVAYEASLVTNTRVLQPSLVDFLR